MENLLWNHQITMIISFTQLIYWPDEDVDEYFEKDSFRILRETMNIHIDVKGFVSKLFDELMDQLDTIRVLIRVQNDRADAVRRLAYNFYVDDNIYNIDYREGCSCASEVLGLTFSDAGRNFYNELEKSSKEKYLFFFSSYSKGYNQSF